MKKRIFIASFMILFCCLLSACKSAQVNTPIATAQETVTQVPTTTSTPLPSATATMFPTPTKDPLVLSTPLENSGVIPTLVGWDYYNGHFYRLTDYLGWQDAEAQAVSWGGHLVTIDNEEEGLWLRDQYGIQHDFWIGFNDIDEEGKWVWASGSTTTYTNWCAGEPSNSGGEFEPEDAAVMNYLEGGESLNCWNDIRVDADVRGIVEKDAR